MPNVYGSKWIRRSTRLAIYLRDRFTCVYCGKDLHGAHVRSVTLDHLVPREQFGSNMPGNLVTACKPCNDSKGDRPWRQWVRARFTDVETVIARVTRARRRTLTRQRRLARAIIAGDESQPYITRQLFIPMPRTHCPPPPIEDEHAWARTL